MKYQKIYLGLLGGVIVVLASFFRLVALEKRPMHGDEANQAYQTGILLEKGVYTYNPTEHHGPTLYFLALPVLWCSKVRSFAESREWQFRIVPAFFGIATILLFLSLRSTLGNGAVLWGALLNAVSPAMVFYSRYYIQESLLVFFTMGLIVSFCQYVKTGQIIWAIVSGICLGLLHSTKETCILTLFSMGVSLIISTFILRRRQKRTFLFAKFNINHVTLSIAVAMFISITLYSSFYKYPGGIWDAFGAYAEYLKRGTDTQMLHYHPWYYYFSLLLYTKRAPGPVWTESFIIGLGLIGAIFSHGRNRSHEDNGLGIFITWYTIVLSIVYSFIPYKTPWCMLSFLHGFIILAGIAIQEILNRLRNYSGKIIFIAICCVCVGHLGYQTYLANFVYPADIRNPYVYAHTSAAISRLIKRVDQLATVSPEGDKLRIDVIAENDDYWPLPWYLRTFKRVGYWNKIPERITGEVIIASSSLRHQIEEMLQNNYHMELHALRPNALLVLFVKKELWQVFLTTLSS